MVKYIGALDLGTTSNRFILFDHAGRIVGLDQMEHEQIFPRPGWVEHDPMEIWRNTQAVIRGALGKTGISGDELAAIGITNQRETTVFWDKTDRPPFLQCRRLAVYPDRRALPAAVLRRRPGPLSGQNRASDRHLLFGSEAALDPG